MNSNNDSITLVYTYGDYNHVGDQGIEWIVDIGMTYHCVSRNNCLGPIEQETL